MDGRKIATLVSTTSETLVVSTRVNINGEKGRSHKPGLGKVVQMQFMAASHCMDKLEWLEVGLIAPPTNIYSCWMIT